MNWVLIGMKHCGKSTLGSALARRWECPFFDVDNMIEDRFWCDTGRRISVRELFSLHGERQFHDLEGLTVCELYANLIKPDSKAVVSLGGRTAINPAIGQLLKDIGLIVYLRVDTDELVRRIRQTGRPAFLTSDDPEAEFLELCEQRRGIYEQMADLTVDLTGLSVEQSLEALVEAIEKQTIRP